MHLTLQEFLFRHGSWVFFSIALIEGELMLLTASVLSGEANLNPIPLWLMAALGSCTGHLSWYFLGRNSAVQKLLTRFPGTHARINRTRKIIAEHPVSAIFALQYLYGMRNLGAAVLGMTHLRPSRFLLIQAVNCTIWAAIVTFCGYYLGNTVLRFFHGTLKWVWIGTTALVLILFFHYTDRFLLASSMKSE